MRFLFHRWLILLSLTFGLVTDRTGGCQICLPIPKKSLVDHLYESDTVVLARENPDKPFSLIAVEVLKGEPGNHEIELFIDSATRRLLEVKPDWSVICVKSPTASDGGWMRVGLLNPEFGPILSEILENEPEWKESREKRMIFFSQYLTSENPQLWELALLEVAAASYQDIRKLQDVVPREEIYSFIGNIRYLEWHALYILLLAQSEEEEDREWIRERMKDCAESPFIAQLAAWATAYLEVDRERALQFLREQYFEKPDRSVQEQEAIILAVSTHGNFGHTDLRNGIVEAYQALIESQPSMATRVLPDLKKWERWEMLEPVAKAADAATELSEQLELRSFIQLANEALGEDVPESEEGGGIRMGPWATALLLVPFVLFVSSRVIKLRKSS